MLGKARALTPVTQSEVVAVVISDSIGEPAQLVRAYCANS